MVSQLSKFFRINSSGLGGIVSEDDNSFLPADKVVDHPWGSRNDIVSQPKNSVSIKDEGVDMITELLEAIGSKGLGFTSISKGNLSFLVELHLKCLLRESSDNHCWKSDFCK